jgi:8-oxo-dGTP pyrophosphatase MutT (NUDIX family)
MNGHADNRNELVEWVNADGSVIEVVTRQKMRESQLRHRATYIAVVNSQDQLIVHKRADWKEVYPGWWDLAFGGVCGAGEFWEESAQRELAEEAGISGQRLEPIGEINYDGEDGSVVGRAYLVRWDGAITFDDGEVVAIDTIDLGHVSEWMADRLVCLDSRQCLAPLLQTLAD